MNLLYSLGFLNGSGAGFRGSSLDRRWFSAQEGATARRSTFEIFPFDDAAIGEARLFAREAAVLERWVVEQLGMNIAADHP